MAAFAISSKAVRCRAAVGIMSASLFGGGVLEQRLARTHDGETHRLVGDLEFAGALARHREGGARQIARLGKILAEMRAATVLAPARRQRNDAAGLYQRAQIEPVVPGEIEFATGIGKAGGEQLALDRIELAERP